MFSKNKNSSDFNKTKTILFCVFITSFLIVSLFFNIKHFYCDRFFDYINSECSELVINKKAYLENRIELSKYFEEQKSLGRISNYSVYFRDLNKGPVMGINELELFSSASLLKLPIVMAVLKLAEDDPKILEINLVNEGGGDSVQQFYYPDSRVEDNVSYTVKNLLEHALIYSDNKAVKMLNDFLYIKGNNTNEIIQLVFRELGLILPDDLIDRDISTRSYASLFRLLYNRSYLIDEYSEFVLKTLSDSYFRIGLKAGVPSDIEVSNKFGERFVGEERQLHDCGIIYYPKNPYLLCVMTQGDNFNDLAEIIRKVSEMVYKEVDSRKL